MLPTLFPATRPTLTVTPNADYAGFGSAQIDLRTRGSLRRILRALVEQRRCAPNTALTAEQVFGAGWPHERVSANAAATRVYTAMYTLRRMGLRGILLRREDGYLIDPAVEVGAPWDGQATEVAS